jgi:hypothetical protein
MIGDEVACNGCVSNNRRTQAHGLHIRYPRFIYIEADFGINSSVDDL